MDGQRSARLARRLRRALGRRPSKDGKLRLRIRREELQQLCELAEDYAHMHQRLGTFDVMRELDCSRNHVYQLVRSGALPCKILPSGTRRFVRQDLLQYVARKLVSPVNVPTSVTYEG
jgi:hypothetical protein